MAAHAWKKKIVLEKLQSYCILSGFHAGTFVSHMTVCQSMTNQKPWQTGKIRTRNCGSLQPLQIMEKQKKDPLPGNNESLDGPDGIRTHDLCGKSFLTQCECVIQTRLDDRSNIAIKRGVFLSLGSTRYVTITSIFYTIFDDSYMLSLEEFDAVIDKMNLAFEYVVNLGQYVEQLKSYTR